MIYGYARVSTQAQSKDGNSLEDQVKALKNYGCDEIVTETFSGRTMERPQFISLLNQLNRGDTLVVCKLDRFARTTVSGIETIQSLFEHGINVEILNMGRIDDTLTGRLILTVLLAFAEYERGMIVERCQSGKEIARQDPNFKDGRPPKFSKEQVELALNLLNEGNTYSTVEKMTGISRSTLYRAKNTNDKRKEVKLCQ